MKCCSLVSASLKNGWTDLANLKKKCPNKIFGERKIEKVARKIGKFGRN
jgi:hypothetical protein